MPGRRGLYAPIVLALVETLPPSFIPTDSIAFARVSSSMFSFCPSRTLPVGIGVGIGRGRGRGRGLGIGASSESILGPILASGRIFSVSARSRKRLPISAPPRPAAPAAPARPIVRVIARPPASCCIARPRSVLPGALRP